MVYFTNVFQLTSKIRIYVTEKVITVTNTLRLICSVFTSFLYKNTKYDIKTSLLHEVTYILYWLKFDFM